MDTKENITECQTYYAIREIKTGRIIAYHDMFSKPPKPYWASWTRPPKLFSAIELPGEIKRRCIPAKSYELVEIRLSIIGRRDLNDIPDPIVNDGDRMSVV